MRYLFDQRSNNNHSRRSLLSPEVVTHELHMTLIRAGELMPQLGGHHLMTPEILLFVFLSEPPCNAYHVIHNLLQRKGYTIEQMRANAGHVAREANAVSDSGMDLLLPDNKLVQLSQAILFILDQGMILSGSRCGSEHALLYMTHQDMEASGFLAQFGLTEKAIRQAIEANPTLGNGSHVDLVSLAHRGQLATTLDRGAILDNLIRLLSMVQRPNVILVGPQGAGKRSLVYSVANRIAAGHGPFGVNKLIEINNQALVADPVGTIEQAFKQADGGILFIPDIDRLFLPSGVGMLAANIGNPLQLAFHEPRVMMVGTATPARYREFVAPNQTMTPNTHTFNVEPANEAETTAMLYAQKLQLERQYELLIDDSAIKITPGLARRYLPDRPLPSSAFNLLAESLSSRRLTTSRRDGATGPGQAPLTADDVTAVLSSLTDIPAPTLLNQDQRQRIAHMPELIHLRIVGQEAAVSAISQTVQMAYAGLKPPQRPIGSFLMLGPTGVGKTELARVLAEFLFGSQEAMLKFDMSEFMNAAAMTRLVGAPFGYIDSEHGGQLTEAVKKRPYSVILFDEIEKADLRVFDLLLQMMDDGRLTSGRGEVVRFSDCLILMTSNLTHEEIFEHFRSEFLNRVDHIVTFHPLSPEQLGQVMDILIAEEGDLLFARKGLTLDVSTPARNWLLGQNQHPEWGGRPLNRLIMNHIRAPLSEIILVHNPAPGQIVRVRLKKGGLDFEFMPNQGGA